MHWRRWLPAVLGLALLTACAAEPVPAAPQPVALQRTVDLSHVIRQDVPYVPAEPLTRLERTADGRLQSLTLGARTGTLLEVVSAPDALLTVDQLSPRDLVHPTVVIDVRDRVQDLPGATIDVADLLAWEARHGAIPAGALVFALTGWDVRWGDAAGYLALDAADHSQAPTFSAAAIDWLHATRAVAGIGIDAPFIPARPTTEPWLLLVNLTNLEQLPPLGTTVIIGALKVQAGDRSPARVLALIEG